MARNYGEIAKIIRQTGFFSEYLPPCFVLDAKVSNRIPSDNCDLIPPYSFTMSRYNGNDSRRSIFIPEIGSYLVVQKYMNEQNIIKELIEFTETSEVSFSPILLDDQNVLRYEVDYNNQIVNAEFDDEVIEGDGEASSYIMNIEEKLIRSTGAKRILRLDISNCYSSYYTHMTPAIMLGMEAADAEFKKSLGSDDTNINPVYIKYAKLDALYRRQNMNRTNGLLPGIMSSRILAEGILTRIDMELKAQGVKYTRYVDDYEVYLYRDEEDKEIISIFGRILKRYGFTINSEKTAIIDFPYYVVDNLSRIFGKYSGKKLSNADLMELFNTFLSLEKEGVKGAIRYLLKSIESQPIETSSPRLFKSYLLSIIENNERALTKACSLLIENKDLLNVNPNDMEYIESALKKHINYEHDLEVIWLLYLLFKMGHIQQHDEIVDLIVGSQNELAQTMLLRAGLLAPDAINKLVQQSISWILRYELYAISAINETEFTTSLGVDKQKEMYNYFKHKSIHFCSL